MNSQLSLNEQKMQEREATIKGLEQKHGITLKGNEQPIDGQRANNEQEPGKPQPRITREEYEVIKSVFERLGCDDLITYSDFFSNFIGFSYDRFFRNQPKVVQVLCRYMNNQTTTNSERSQIQSYIDNLESVLKTLYLIVENNAIFDEAEILCDTLDEAHTQYK